MLDTRLDGYKKLLITLISILSMGAIYFFTPATASMAQQLLAIILALGIAVLGMVGNHVVATFDRAKIMAAPLQLRRMVSATPLTGLEPVIYAAGTLLAALVTYFIKDPGQATTLQQVVSQVLVPLAMLIIGGQAAVTQAGLNQLKLAPVTAGAVTGATPPPVQIVPPVPASITPENEDYTPINLDNMIKDAKERMLADQSPVNDWGLAFYFRQLVVNLDGRTIPKAFRIAEFERLIGKSLELFNTGFIAYTNIKTPPTPDQVARPMIYYTQLKEDYMFANHIPCGNRTFEELKRVINEFNKLYQAQYGLKQLEGKTCDWSIYGGGNFGPLQVGLDWVDLTT